MTKENRALPASRATLPPSGSSRQEASRAKPAAVNAARFPRLVAQRIHECAPDHSVETITVGELRRAASELAALYEALENLRLAAEYWAGCDEGCDADTASSEIMSSGGAWPAEAYDKANVALARARGEQP